MISIIFNEEYLPNETIMGLMSQAAELCMQEEKVDVPSAEVSMSFVSPEEIQELNRIYRDVDKITDVLSFPQYQNTEEIQAEKGVVCLGDIVIAPEIAAIQAEEYGHSKEREIVYLMVHSMLHLFGYDHMDEQEQSIMRIKEDFIMDKLGVSRDYDGI